MIKSINANELKEKIDANDNLILIDCREQDEWNAGHIEQALFIPLSQFKEQYSEKLTDKNARIVIQCRSGKRSLSACQLLAGEGFENLTNLEGGILGWQQEDYKIIEE